MRRLCVYVNDGEDQEVMISPSLPLDISLQHKIESERGSPPPEGVSKDFTERRNIHADGLLGASYSKFLYVNVENPDVTVEY